MKTPNKTIVVFRTFRRGNDVIAIFPLEPVDSNPFHCSSYPKIGEHGVSTTNLSSRTRASSKEEIAELSSILQRRGYTLDIRKRIPGNAFRVRLVKLNQRGIVIFS